MIICAWFDTNLSVWQSLWLYICMMHGLFYNCMPNLEYMCVGFSKCLSLTSQLTRAVESHSGARGNILVGPQTFSQGPSGEKIFEFFFSIWYIMVYFIFLADGRVPQTLQGPG